MNIVPNNTEFERALIVSVLSDPLLLPKISVIVEPNDFYKSHHRHIWETIVNLGENADSLSVQTKLKPEAEIYFKELVEDSDRILPAISNAIFYAETVKQKSKLRAGIELGQEIIGICYQEQDGDEAIQSLEDLFANFLQKRVLEEVSESSTDAFRKFLGSLHTKELNDPNSVKTGFTELDLMTQRMEGLIVLAARPGMGKGGSLDSKVLTPKGFVTMGSLNLGDKVIGRNGSPTTVIGIYPLGKVPIYKVTTTDGRSTECTNDHLWLTETRNERRAVNSSWSVKETSEIRKTLTRNDNASPNHALPINEPCEFISDQELKLHPYLLGLLLGDGGFTRPAVSFTNSEEDIQTKIISLLPGGDSISFKGNETRITGGGKKSETLLALKYYGLHGHYSHEKFIPTDYLYASVIDRINLLTGLLDTDGNICDSGLVEYSTSSKQLCLDVEFLVRSLGGIVSTSDRIPHYTYKGVRREGRRNYRMVIRFPSNLCPVSSLKHLNKWSGPNGRQEHVSIKDIQYIGDKEAQCIRVSAEDSLYITDDFIVTHNTALAINIAANIAKKEQGVVFFSLEQDRNQVFERMLSAESEVPLEEIRSGAYKNDEQAVAKIERTQEMMEHLMPSIHIDDRANVPTSYMASVARQKKYEWGSLGLIIVDYLHIVRLNGKQTVDALGDATKELRALGKELGCPVLLLSQLRREDRDSKKKRPELSDLRSSGEIEQSADMVWFIWRESYYDQAGLAPSTDVAEVIVSKSRNGRQGIIQLEWLPNIVKFANLGRR